MAEGIHPTRGPGASPQPRGKLAVALLSVIELSAFT